MKQKIQTGLTGFSGFRIGPAIAGLLIVSSSLFAQEVADVSDPSAVKLQTPDRGVVVSGTLQDTLANYPKLKEALIAETVKKLEQEDEMAAVKRVALLAKQNVQLPQDAINKHNARLDQFRKMTESKLLIVVKKDPLRAKAKMEERIAGGLAISTETQKVVNAAQPKPSPTPTPQPTPDDGL